MLDPKDRDRMLIEMHSLICDTNGNEGICTQFRKHKESDERFRKDYYTFKRNLLMFVGFIGGGGGITAGVLELLKRLQ